MEKEYLEKYCTYQLTGNWFADFNPLSKMNILAALAISVPVMPSNLRWIYGAGICVLYYVIAMTCHKLKSFNKFFSKIVLVMGFFIIIVRLISVEGTTVNGKIKCTIFRH